MKKISTLMVLSSFAIMSPVSATTLFSVAPGTFTNIPNNNDFKGDLSDLGLSQFVSTGSAITLSRTTKLKFEFLGSESGHKNVLTALGITPFAESDGNFFSNPQLIGSAVFSAGSLQNSIFFTSGDAASTITNIGDAGFAIFQPNNSSDIFNTDVLYLGLDDFISNSDDNHDDFLVRVSAVPEPSTWLSMILGFGFVGLARRRRTTGLHASAPS